jgi:hypothetical protein
LANKLLHERHETCLGGSRKGLAAAETFSKNLKVALKYGTNKLLLATRNEAPPVVERMSLTANRANPRSSPMTTRRPSIPSISLESSALFGLSIEGRMATMHRPTISRNRAKKAKDLESIAQLLEDVIPNFKREEERQFYGEIVESYRLAAHDVLRNRRRLTKAQRVTRQPTKKPTPAQ